MDLSGKVFVVTGAGSGIGRATVKKLLQQSAVVHALDLNDIAPHENLPGRQVTYKVDVTSRKGVKAVFDQIALLQKREDAPWLHGLVNCAGLLRPSSCSTDAKGDEIFETLWKVNVMGTWYTATEFHERLQAARGENPARFGDATTSIVNIGSMASVRGIVGMAGYVASKHAVLGISRTLAQELGPAGFRVNTVAPGGVNTPMLADAGRGSEQHQPGDAALQGAFKQMSEPEEIADTILFLLGDGASSISGHLLEVNGGWP
jgi:NAD(P)-dependent dehydrogenase (short-subunit alcohol dehydrogenase family)